MTNDRYLLNLDAAVLAMEMHGKTAPAWMSLPDLPPHLLLTEGRHLLAMDLVEETLPPALVDEIQLACGRMGDRRENDPPLGFRLESVVFFAAHGALMNLDDVPTHRLTEGTCDVAA